MTDVNKNKKTLITTPADARPLYAPTPAEFTGKVGVEVEMILFQTGDGKPVIPDASTMQTMQSQLREMGYDAQLEPAGVLEYASYPAALEDVPQLARTMTKDIDVFEKTAESYGFKRAFFSVMPTTTHDDALSKIVARERLGAVIQGLTSRFGKEALDFSLLGTGVQTSFSPKDSDELYDMTRRGYMLTPLLLAAMNSSSGYSNNNPEYIDRHVRGNSYLLAGPAGGIAESFLNASSGDEFIKNHIDFVFKTPMHFAYKDDGSLLIPPAGEILNFEQLIKMGLNTQSNYELAETFVYNDIKICNLRDASGDVVGKRVEVRAADSGKHQPLSTLLLTAAIVPSGPTAEAFEETLKNYGFTNDPKQDAELLKAARDAAVNHKGQFMDIPFGTGSMRDFAADVAGILVNHYDGQKLDAQLAPLMEILTTGNVDAKCFAQKYSSLSDLNADLQKGHVPTVAGNDNKLQSKQQPKKKM